MYNGHTRPDDYGTVLIKGICAVAFFLFFFFYVFNYQADLLAYVQHVLSGGQTAYNRWIGTIVLTLMAFVLRWTADRLYQRLGLCYVHALTYLLPGVAVASITVLAGSWAWFNVLLNFLVFFLAISILSRVRTLMPSTRNRIRVLTRELWYNLLALLTICLLTLWMGNNNTILHYRLRMEQLMAENRYDEALDVGRGTIYADPSLTMLRTYALSRTGKAGDLLFTYPVSGGSEGVKPGPNAHCLMYPENIISSWMNGKGRRDALLLSYLLERDVESFAATVGKYYDIKSDPASLPRHYAEALVQHNYKNRKPVLRFSDNALEADYHDYLTHERYGVTENSEAGRNARFYNTYWFYYKNCLNPAK